VGSKRKKAQKAKFESGDLLRYGEAIGEAFSGPDRTAAIMMGTLVENYLEQSLRLRLVVEKQFLDKMFEYPNILATFAAKIDMCYTLGVIGKTALDNLRIIKDIRNTFAHDLLLADDKSIFTLVTFETPIIRAWCHSLKCDEYVNMLYQFPGGAQTDFWSTVRNLKTRHRYTDICLWIVTILEKHIKSSFKHTPPAIVLP
jgi:hypothetical protein